MLIEFPFNVQVEHLLEVRGQDSMRSIIEMIDYSIKLVDELLPFFNCRLNFLVKSVLE